MAIQQKDDGASQANGAAEREPCERRSAEASNRASSTWKDVVLTIKILAVFAVIGAALWGFETWMSMK